MPLFETYSAFVKTYLTFRSLCVHFCGYKLNEESVFSGAYLQI